MARDTVSPGGHGMRDALACTSSRRGRGAVPERNAVKPKRTCRPAVFPQPGFRDYADKGCFFSAVIPGNAPSRPGGVPGSDAPAGTAAAGARLSGPRLMSADVAELECAGTCQGNY